MWQLSDEIMANMESKHDSRTSSLLHELVQSRSVENASLSSLNQQSNTSSLESVKSFSLDGIQALSTSCSEDSFEMSSPTSRPTTELPSQLSLHDLNLTSNILGPKDSVQPLNISFDCQDRKSSEYNSSDQMSRDSLEPFNSLEKSNSLKNMDFTAKGYPPILISNQPDRFDVSNDVRELSRGGTGAVESWPMEPDISSVCKSKNYFGRDKASLRESIKKELDNLDTRLPQLDFNKLEEKLNCAAKERIVTERKLLGEQIL